jgi:hypothetical protein
VLVKLVRNIDKQVILARRKESAKLKVFMNDDLAPMDQFQKKLLSTQLRSLKSADPDIWGSIRGNSLHVKKAGHIVGRYEVRDGIVKETAQPMI